MKELIKNQIAKRLKKAILKKVLLLIGPHLLLIFGITLIVLIILGVTYSTIPVAGGDTNMDGVVDDKDKGTISEYIKLADNWNLYDTWLVSSGTGENLNSFLDRIGKNTKDITPEDEENIEQIISERQTYDNYTNVHTLLDRDGKDIELSNNWGSLHSYLVFWMYTTGNQELLPELHKDFARELHPKFKYRTSTRTDCHEVKDEDGAIGCECNDTTEYLLTEADTMKGHFLYTYEYVTVGEGCNTSTYEQLSDVQLISPENNRWEKIEKYLIEHYELPTEDAESIRTAYLHSETAYFKEQEEIAWLMEESGIDNTAIVPFGVIPENIRALCETAGEQYGIDPAILMAVAFVETGGRFNPTSYNSESGATGLMQFLPTTWEAYKQDGDGDGQYNMYSPADSIYSAANYIKSLLGPDFTIPTVITSRAELGRIKDTCLDALEHYGGVYGTEGAKQYAEGVYNLAQSFKGTGSGYAFPVKGYSLTNVTLGYDPQMNNGSHSGRRSGHYGVDIAATTGTPVLATVSGTVHFAGNGGDAGKFVQILGDDRLMHDYMHLNSINVTKGQTVTGGQQIGTVGSTGYSTGPHLHYGVQQYPYRGYSGNTAHIDCISPMPIISQARSY